jgi:PBSX family phage terminase large subunit
MVDRPGQIWVVAEPTSDMIDRILLTPSPGKYTLPDFLSRFDPQLVFLRSKGIIRSKLGTVVFATGERPSSIQGAQLGGVWLDEAGLMKYEAFATALQRCGFYDGKILITTTPYNMGWLKTQVYDKWVAGDPDYNVIKFSSLANPLYPRAMYDRAKRTMSPARFRMLYEGDFGRPEGMIYDCFDETKHLVDPFDIPIEWERSGGLDFGFNNPTAGVFLAKDGDGVYYWYDEHYVREQTLDRHAAQLTAKGGGSWQWFADPSAEQQIAELRRRRMTVTGAVNDVQAGIDTVYAMMAAGRLKIFRTCVNGIDELSSYAWKKQDAGFTDEPVKEYDHLMDALRYALHTQEGRTGLRFWT